MRSQPWLKCFPGDEFSDDRLRVLRPECRALVADFRWFMWKNNGLEDNDQHLETLAKESCGFSRYRFRKWWPTVKKIFTVIDGRLFFDRDEEQRGEIQEEFVKRQKISSIANSARWQSKRQAAAGSAQPAAEDSSMMDFERDPSRAEPEPEGEAYTEGDPATAAIQSTVVGVAAAAGSSPDSNFSNSEPITAEFVDSRPLNSPSPPSLELGAVSAAETDFQALVIRAGELGLPVPTREFAAKLRKNFFGHHFNFRELPLFPEQRSVGLWLSKSFDEVATERERQKCPQPERKGAKAEATARARDTGIDRAFNGK